MDNGLLVICSVHDTKAEIWEQPLFFQSKGQAWRAFSDAVNKEDSPFNKHHEDYALYSVGYFDPFSGTIDSHVPVVVCTGPDVFHPENQQ